MKFRSIIIASMLIAQLVTTSVFAAPSVTITEPSSGSFALQGNSFKIRAQVSGNPSTVAVYYSCRSSIDNNTSVDMYLCTLSRESSTSTYYSRTITTPNFYFPRLSLSGDRLVVYTPKLKVVGTDATGSTSKTIDFTISCQGLSAFRGVDPNFRYSSLSSNDIRGVATGSTPYASKYWTYNCMAYAIDRSYQGWMWFNVSSPSDSLLVSTMKSYGYNTSSKTPLSGARVVYYKNGHFSKVVSYDSNGMPKTIVSKWGGQELVFSSSVSPFSSAYGSAYYYFK